MSECRENKKGHLYQASIRYPIHKKSSPVISSLPPTSPDKIKIAYDAVCIFCGDTKRKLET